MTKHEQILKVCKQKPGESYEDHAIRLALFLKTVLEDYEKLRAALDKIRWLGHPERAFIYPDRKMHQCEACDSAEIAFHAISQPLLAVSGWIHEDNLKEVREPMRVEFECEWQGSDAHYTVRPTYIRNIIKPFVGKRTRVKIEEIVE